MVFSCRRCLYSLRLVQLFMVFLYTLFTISLFGMHHDNFISQSTTTAVDVHGCDVAAAVPSPPAVKSGSQQGALDSRGEGSEAKHTSLRSSIHHEEDVLSGAAKLCAKGQNSYSFLGREHSKEHWQEQAGMVLLTIVVVSCKLTSSEPNTDRSHSRSLRRGSLQLVRALRHQLRSSF